MGNVRLNSLYSIHKTVYVHFFRGKGFGHTKNVHQVIDIKAWNVIPFSGRLWQRSSHAPVALRY